MGDALAVVLMEKRNFQPEQFAMFHPGGSLGRKLLTKVQDVMRTQNIPTVEASTSFKELIFTMTDGKLGLALVLENEKLVGLVSDGDLRRAWRDFENLGDKTASDIMSENPKTIAPEMMLVDAEKILLDNKITCLIVAKENKIMGVLQLYAI
jgi:arabinose-5-phosphate isomerase